MALTPEDITQKTFTTRFRGIDPEEVREFLDLTAAQMSELEEQLRQRVEKIGEQDKELELAADDKKSFDDVLDVFKKKIETLSGELAETKQGDVRRAEELERLKRLVEGVQQERDSLKSELGRAQVALSESESKSRMSRAAVEGLRNKIMVIEAEKSELLAEIEQFQTKIAETRHHSGELEEESKRQAEQITTAAREEIAQLRERASQELKGIRDDIENLSLQRRQLQTDLRELLHAHLDRLSEFSTGTAGPSRSEYDDLFQKIDFTELSELESDLALDETLADPLAAEKQTEESEEILRSKLKDGGIAYLSDE
ncbi:MAG: DivIVA domain-containing protein [Desulfocapsaceae bacterium]